MIISSTVKLIKHSGSSTPKNSREDLLKSFTEMPEATVSLGSKNLHHLHLWEAVEDVTSIALGKGMCWGFLLSTLPTRGCAQADSSSANPPCLWHFPEWIPLLGSVSSSSLENRREKGAWAYSSLISVRLLTEMMGCSSFNMTPVKATFITHRSAAHPGGTVGLCSSVLSLSRQHSYRGDVTASVYQVQWDSWENTVYHL